MAKGARPASKTSHPIRQAGNFPLKRYILSVFRPPRVGGLTPDPVPFFAR